MSTGMVDRQYRAVCVERATSLQTQMVAPPVLSEADQNIYFIRREPCSWLISLSQLSFSHKESGLRVAKVCSKSQWIL